EGDRELSIQVIYVASCEPYYESRVAEALSDGPHPVAVLNDRIRRWLHEYERSRPGFIDDFLALQMEVQAYIKSKALAEVGLNLSIKFNVDGDCSEDLIDFGPLTFAVRVSDYDDEQRLKVRGELRRVNARGNAVVQNRDRQ